MKILFVIPHMFLPPNTGNKYLIFNLLKYLSSKAECDLIILVENENNSEIINILKSEFTGIDNIWLFKKPKGIKLFLYKVVAVAKFEHPVLGNYWSKKLASHMKQLVGNERYDLIHYDMFYMAQYKKYCQNIKSILVPSDAYSLSAALSRQASTNYLYKIKLLIKEILLKRYEKKAYTKFNVICPVAQTDTQYLSGYVSGVRFRTIGVAVGKEYTADEPRNFDKDVSKKNQGILYVGSISIHWMEASLIKFYKNALVGIRKELPSVQFTVLGKSPSTKLKKYINSSPYNKHIEYVENYIKFLQKDWVYVHVQKTNAGYQTRVQQAMSLGLPVVAYPLAFTGMDVKHGEHCYICHTQEEITHYTLKLLKDKDLRKKIGVAGADHIRYKYSIQNSGDEMLQIYKETINDET